MKNCSQCGAEMQDVDKFCISCGSAANIDKVEQKTTPVQGAASSPKPASQPLTYNSDKVSQRNEITYSVDRLKPKRGSGLRTKLILGAILAIILALGGFWGWNTYGTEAQVEKKLDLAVKYLSENNYEQAILAFNDAIKIDPKEVKGYQGLARTYSLQGNYDSAKDTYEKGIATVNPQNKQILQLGLAGMYIDQNKLTDAERAYSQIMNTSPNCLEAYWGLAVVYNQQGDNSKAEAILRQAVEKNPNEYRGYNTLALFLSQNNKQDEALDNIVQSLTLDLNQQEAYLVLDSMFQNNWAELRGRTGGMSNQTIAAMLEFYSYYAACDYPNAINTYQSKLTSQTTNQKARILAAICIVKSGDKSSAETIIKKIDVPKLSTWLLSDLGRYYLAAGDQTKAKKYAVKALQANPTNTDAIALLQFINSGDPDAKFYTARALLYNWRPIHTSAQQLLNWNEMSPQNTKITPPEPIDPFETGNSVGNMVNNGYICQKGGWVYYSNFEDNHKLYRMKANGSEKQKLNDDKSSEINVVGSWIYYVNESDQLKLYKIGIDGNGRKKLSDLTDLNYINVVGNWIFFSNGDPEWYRGEKCIWRINTDGSGQQRITSDVPWFINVVGDWVYYTTVSEGKIYRVKIDGSMRQKLNDDYSVFVNVVGEWVYYSNDSDKRNLYRVKTDGSQRQKLTDEQVCYLNVVDDWIYYCAGMWSGPLCRVKTDGSGKEILDNNQCNLVNVTNDWIYYNIVNGKPPWKMEQL